MTTSLEKMRRHGSLFLFAGILLVVAMIVWERRQTQAVGHPAVSTQDESDRALDGGPEGDLRPR